MIFRCGFALCVAALAMAAPAQEKSNLDKLLERFQGEFVEITPGQGMFPKAFEMGTKDGPAEEKPVLKVTMDDAFAMAKYEMTQELYEAVMGKNPSKWKGPRNAVEMVSLDDARNCCTKLTELMRVRKLIKPGELISVPREKEWEYCCRAGTTTAFSFGDDPSKLGEFCWFTGNAKGNDPPVGAKKPNPWGLYDMHGYGWEWCRDGWAPTYEGYPINSPIARRPSAKNEFVIRGGSWQEKAEDCRSASRRGMPGDTRSQGIGFRCVRVEEGKEKQP